MKSKHCFLALIDLLGFSKLVSGRSLKEVEVVLRQFQQITKKLVFSANDYRLANGLDKGRRSKLNLFSDLVLIHTEGDSHDDCMDIIEVCSKVFLIAFQNGLLPRGSIAWGEMIISPSVIVGKPLVEAHFLETQQEWSGISFCDSMYSWNSNKGKTKNNKSSILEVMEEQSWIVRWYVPIKLKKKEKRYAINWLMFDKRPFWHSRFSDKKKSDEMGYVKIQNTERFYKHLYKL